ncbi:ribonuclease T2 [Anaeromyces robustus]|uniref:ribonuclease T2 n=1 Tax=Anaeromyces robustus TaxID=1754192 RepID=A0A1Y1WTE8_9FUNG|nr:ribonuclease T2 [Anaeromyces robustus]|eukprot:ORX76807.1 ribonuclease T2 [Anaeromyces robustus]
MKHIINLVTALLLTLPIFGRVFNTQLVLTDTTNKECPSFDIVACSNEEKLVNRCCVPDQGHLVLALQWLPSYCKNAGRNKPCKKGTLKKVEKDTWTLHGLWPGNCDGKTYLTNCNPEREEENIEEVIRSKDSELLSEMEKIWLSGNPDPLKDNNWFWAHEWNKHGQCVSTITPQCLGNKYEKNDDIISYFEKAVELRSLYDLYPILERADIVPNDKEGYTLDTLQGAFKNAFNNTRVEINCVYNKRERRQYMSEVRLCFHAKNAFEVEGPINCLNEFSRCNPRYKVFYAVNPTKVKTPQTSNKKEDNEEDDHYLIYNDDDDDDDENDEEIIIEDKEFYLEDIYQRDFNPYIGEVGDIIENDFLIEEEEEEKEEEEEEEEEENLDQYNEYNDDDDDQ